MRKRGFTLIELLVVIAIIGILAAIVLVSLTGARKKAKDAAIQTDLAQVRTIAEEIYVDNNSYTKLCSGGTLDETQTAYGLDRLESDITDKGGSNTCYVSTDGEDFCVEAKLNSGDYFCIDSSGVARTNTTAQCTAAGADCTP